MVVVNATMHGANEAQQYHLMLPELAELRQAFAWAIQHELAKALSLTANCTELMYQFNLLYEHLDWCERALKVAQQQDDEALLASVWRLLGNTLSRVATLPNEDCRQRLYDALAAYDVALDHYRSHTAPLDYGMTHNNRGNVLNYMATLPGEDARQRLNDALTAYDEALKYCLPDTAPVDYAMIHSNRGNVFNSLATLRSENPRQRQLAALSAYDEALRFRRPEIVPLDYAMTQNNRVAVLRILADMLIEDGRQRLTDALAASDEALTRLLSV